MLTPDEVQRLIELNSGYDREAAAAPQEPADEPTPTGAMTTTSEITPTGETTPAAAPLPTWTPLPTATPMTEDAFQARYNDQIDALASYGITEEMFRSWFAADQQLVELWEVMASEHPTMTEQIELRYLTTTSEDEASGFADRLAEGEEYQAIVDEINAITDTMATHTELVWYPRSEIEGELAFLGTALVDLAFDLEVGAYSEPQLSEDGTTYAILSVTGHEEERELEPVLLNELIEEAYQDWLLSMIAEFVERLPYDSSIIPTRP